MYWLVLGVVEHDGKTSLYPRAIIAESESDAKIKYKTWCKSEGLRIIKFNSVKWIG